MVIKPSLNCFTPSKVIIMEDFKGYNHAKIERPSLNSVHQKANVKVFVKSENISIISLEYVQN